MKSQNRRPILPRTKQRPAILASSIAALAVLCLAGPVFAQQNISYTDGENNTTPITITAATNPTTLSIFGMASATQSGVISDAGTTGNLIFNGAITGTLTLSGVNTYTGTTTVNGGALVVNGSIASTAMVTVNNGAILAGSGSIAGPVTINSGGKLIAGDGFGTLTLTLGALSLHDGSIIIYGLEASNSLSTIPDVIVNGDLTLGGTLNIGSIGLSLIPGTYDLFSYTGSLSGTLNLGQLPFGSSASQFKITTTAGQVDLVVRPSGQYWNGSITTADGTVHGGSGNWDNSTQNWTDPDGATSAHWTSGPAIFSAGSGTVTVTDDVTATKLYFESGSGAYTISVSAGHTLTVGRPSGTFPLFGTGVTNNSGLTQNFVTVPTAALNFTNDATAGNVTITNQGVVDTGHTVGGATTFHNFSSAGSATIINGGGNFPEFNVTNTAGSTSFYETSTAGSATITNQGSSIISGSGSVTTFNNSSTAGSANITNQTNTGSAGAAGATIFNDNSSAGTASIANQGGNIFDGSGGNTGFNNASTAGWATIINQAATSFSMTGGATVFHNSATAGSAMIVNQAGSTGGFGLTFFYDNSTAGNATINNQGSSQIVTTNTRFYNHSTAGNATISNLGGVGIGAAGGGTQFNDSSSAGQATITNQGGNAYGIYFSDTSFPGNTTFVGTSSAGNATIINQAGAADYIDFFDPPRGGGYTTFGNTNADSPTAANATIINEGGTALGTSGGFTYFDGNSTAGKATIITNGGTNGGGGGTTSIEANADGGTARAITNGNGVFDIEYAYSTVNGYANNSVHIGSIEGSGNYYLGGNILIVGGNNLSTTVSGVISNAPIPIGGVTGGGSLVKVGTGTLTLTGANTYTGPTTINGGAIIVDGSLGGTIILNDFGAAVTVNKGGTLGGTGIIAVPVFINSGGTLTHGSSPGTLTVGALTLKAGSDVDYQLGAPGIAGDSDFTFVGGNLTLGGKLDITADAGFATGTYELFNYSGTLSGSLSLGALPAGYTASNFKIQTGGGQVDLIVTDSFTGQYWNGLISTANGTVNGGQGTWDNIGTNWTNATGTTNTTWAKSAAIFSTGGGNTISSASQVNISDNVTAGAIDFAGGSGFYNLAILSSETLTINGGGITNHSGVVQTFTTQPGSTLNFSNTATAGTSTQIINLGGTGFNIPAGATNFQGASSAGAASIINQGTAVYQSGGGGVTTFHNTSTAANATIVNQTGAYGDGTTIFNDTATAGGATITNQGALVAGGYTANTQFYNHSTAGSATITNQAAAVSGANGAYTQFNDTSTAGSATITNQNGTLSGTYGGYTEFAAKSTAGSATIINQGATFNGATLFGSTGAGFTIFGSVFTDTPTAGSATIINNGGTTNGAVGGSTVFSDSSNAGNATIITNGGTNGGAGGTTYFEDSADGGTARVITNGNGIFDIQFATQGVHIGSIEGSGTYHLGSGILIVGGNNLSTTVSGVLADGGRFLGSNAAITKVGTGTLTLTGSNTYTGLTSVSGGTLQIGNGLTGSLADSSVTVSGTASLVTDLADTSIFTQNVTLSTTGATWKAIQSGTNSLSGVISGTGVFNQDGPGTTILTNTETDTGATLVSIGTLQIGNGTTGNLTAASAVTVANNASLDTNLANGSKFASKVNLNGVGASLTALQSGTNTLSGVISGTGFFDQNGGGTTILTGAETYTGPTNINDGTLEVDGTLAAGSTVQVATGATLTGKGKIGGKTTLAGNGVINLGAGASIGGTLAITGGNWNGLGTVTGLVTSGTGTFNLNGSLTAPAGLTWTSGTLAGSGTLTGSLNYTSTANSTFDGTIAGTASKLTMNVTGGATTLTLTGNNTYGGATNVTSGTLEIDGSLATGSTVNVAAAGTLTGTGTIHGNATLGGNGTIDLGPNGDIAGKLAVTGGNWTGGGTVGGVVTSSSGTFTIGSGGSLTAASGLVITGGMLAGNGTLTGNLSYITNAISTFGGAIDGSSALTVSITGTAPSPLPIANAARLAPSLTLTGISTYTGATTINRGSLEVNGSLADTVVTLNNGGILGGTGSIAGPVTINAGGTLAPGGDSSPDTLTVGALTLKTGSAVDYRLGASGATAAGNNDLTVVNGNLILGGKLNISAGFGFGAGTYPLFDYAGTLQLGSTLSLGTLPAGYTASDFTLQTFGNQVDLVVTGGPVVQYWNDSATTASGTITGGSGNWDNVTTNWTNPTGTANTVWKQSVAVFSAGSGTVNVGTGNMIGITVSALGFVSGSGAYTLVVGTDKTLTINGAGITNNSGVTQNLVAVAPSPTSDEFGTIEFTNSASAGNVTITNVGTAIQNSYGGQTHFLNSSTAETATIINQGATVSSANGSQTVFDNTSTAGSATTINNGGTDGGGGGGTYFLTHADGGTASVTNNGNGFLDISGLTSTGMKIGSIAGSGTVFLGSKTLTTGGNNQSTTYSGVISDGGFFNGAKGSLAKAGTGTLVLSGNNTYTGTTTVSAGTLQVGDGTSGSVISTSAVTVAANATLALDLANGATFSNKIANSGHVVADDSPASNYTLASVISGSGNLTKTGANTVTVTGANTYSGGTAINSGALVVMNTTGSGTGTGPVTINNGGTLGGSGKITGATTLNRGGTIAPGARSPGVAGTTLHATSLIWNPGSQIDLQIGSGGADELVLTGALTKGTSGTGAYTIDLADDGGIPLGFYTLATFASTTFASTTFAATSFTLDLPGNYQGTLSITGGKNLVLDLTAGSGEQPADSEGTDLLASDNAPTPSTDSSTPSFSITPTPEPTSAALLAFGGIALLGWRRRRVA